MNLAITEPKTCGCFSLAYIIASNPFYCSKKITHFQREIFRFASPLNSALPFNAIATVTTYVRDYVLMAVGELYCCVCLCSELLACCLRSLFRIYMNFLLAFTWQSDWFTGSSGYALTTLLYAPIFLPVVRSPSNWTRNSTPWTRHINYEKCKLLVRVYCCVLWIYAVCKSNMHTRLREQ